MSVTGTLPKQRKITHVKYLKEVVEIGWIQERPDMPSNETHSFSSKDKPTLAFLDSLSELGKHVINILELKKGSEIIPTGFSLKYKTNSEDLEYYADCVITSKYKLKDSTGTIAINCPMRSEHDVGEGQLMPADMAHDIQTFIDFAEKYLDGDRIGKQSDMFADSPEKVPEPDKEPGTE